MSNKMTPNVRFKGFTDAWEQRKLQDVSERVRGNDGKMNLSTLTISASVGWLDQKTRFSQSIAGKEKKELYPFEKRTIIIQSWELEISKIWNYF